MTPAAAIAQAKKGNLGPIYLVTGEERFLRDGVVDALRAACLGGGIAAFNEDRFFAGEADVEKILSAARTVPMMAPRRFVLVRNVERWDTAGEESKGTSALERLTEYVASPVESTCIVLTGAKLDGRRKLSGIAKKQGFLVACEILDRRELVRWVADEFATRGHAIDEDVAELLAEIGGPELAYLHDSVERLSLYVGQGSAITEAAVSECITRVRMADTWALVAAVGARDLSTALRHLADVYDPRDRGLPLLGAVAWSIRQLARFQAAKASGATEDEAAKRAGVFQPFRARELATRVRAFRPKELERWLLVLAETDLALKSSRRPADAILEDMLTRLCGPLPRSRATA